MVVFYANLMLYDHVNWNFLIWMLENIGFNVNWIS